MATSYNIETIQGDNIQLSLRVRNTDNTPIKANTPIKVPTAQSKKVVSFSVSAI